MVATSASIDVARVARALDLPPRRASGTAGARRAAVALVLAGDAPPALLLIERARHDADPWSGHLALPGGRVDATDRSVRDACEREAREEVGLDLALARYLGELGEFAARPVAMTIAVHAYALAAPPPLACDPREVARAFWVPLAHLADPARHVVHRAPRDGTERPAVRLAEPDAPVLWGLTYHFLEVLFDRLGAPLPPTGWLVER